MENTFNKISIITTLRYVELRFFGRFGQKITKKSSREFFLILMDKINNSNNPEEIENIINNVSERVINKENIVTKKSNIEKHG